MTKSPFYYFLFLCLLGVTTRSWGQSDTLVNIEEVEVSALKIREQVAGGILESWNDDELEKRNYQNVAELLSNESGVYIKSYGAGSLATSSIRGGSAAHTLVLWNGMPLGNPMLGLLDLSLLPVNSSEEILLQRGGKSALWGSGAIGGVLSLNNHSDFTNKFEFANESKLGSFGSFSERVNLKLGNSSIQSSTSYSHLQADNDFKYEIGPDLPKRTQSNAALSQQNFMQDLYLKPGNRHRLSAHFWQQQSEREIPPTNVQTSSVARQEDVSTRAILKGAYFTNNTLLNVQVGYTKEKLNYFDDAILLESLSQFTSINSELSGQFLFQSKHRFYAGLNYVYTKAESGGYANDVDERRISGFLSYQYSNEKWMGQVSVRQELTGDGFVPLVPELGINFNLSPSTQAKLKLSRNYRLPTLNDRYWTPGGNPDLKAESGWSQELSIVSDWQKGSSNYQISVTGFNRNIDDWILWTPVENQFIWSPINLEKVWSRGLEARLGWTYKKADWQFKIKLGYDYLRSTYQFSLSSPMIEEGRQLLYTPVNQLFGQCSLEWKGLYLNYQHRYTSKTIGQNENLPSYQTTRAKIAYQIDPGKYSIKLFFNLHNVWDQNYQIIERRPMPGINYELGLNFKFRK